MVEHSPQKKQEEQYPLLKVDGGAGDVTTNAHVAPAQIAPSWAVTCTPKQSWLVRWPEYISACWMTFILLGISFLVFYGLGMEACRRQPLLLVKCNGSKPASDVFYHKILSRGSNPSFMMYSEYLSSMALQYPMLNFHVYFLIDDSVQSLYRVVPRHPRLINPLIPIKSIGSSIYKMNDGEKRDIEEFQRRHYNVNVTVMPLSKYMAMTPLKYKWRNIPTSFLTFYTRVFSVWQYGGVGMDLYIFNNYFDNRQYIDRRISTILKQHNDGIKPEEYTKALYKIDQAEENELFSLICGLIHSIFNETQTFFSKTIQSFSMLDEDFLNRSEPLLNRSKRDISNGIINNDSAEKNSVFVDVLNTTNTTDLKKYEYQTSVVDVDANTNTAIATTKVNDIENIINLERSNKSKVKNETSDQPHLLLFYDFSVFSDSFPAFISDAFKNPEVVSASRESKSVKFGKTGTYLLSMDSEGLFIAASSRLHPFLGRLISAGCQRMRPTFAIQDTLLTQCSGIFKDDAYCNNIYIL